MSQILKKQTVDAKDSILLQLLQECVHDDNKIKTNQVTVDIKALCNEFETMLRSTSRQTLSSAFNQIYFNENNNNTNTNMNSNRNINTNINTNSIDCLISQFLRSQTLHLLVGLTQMEAKCVHTRNCARRAMKKIVWSIKEEDKSKLNKAQIPFLPTITQGYKTFASQPLLIHTKDKDILVVGDGNLSFGRALSRLFGSPSTKQRLSKLKKRIFKANNKNNINTSLIDYGARNVVVTCYESAMELLSRYPHSGSVVAEIVDRGGLVLYGIDATNLKETLSSSFQTYGGDRKHFHYIEINKF